MNFSSCQVFRLCNILRMATGRPLDPATVREIADAYAAGQQPTSIARAWGVSSASVFRALKKHDVPLRRPTLSHRKRGPSSQLAVAVDANELVVDAAPVSVPRGHSQRWEVHYTGIIEVDAESIDQALARARDHAGVRRIYTIRLRS